MDAVCGSKFWDWNLTWYSEHPDLTPCFKNTVLFWLPCAFLWIFSPLQAYYMKRSEARDIPFNCFNVLKLVSIFIVTILQLTNAIHKYVIQTEPRIYIFTPIIICATFVLFFILTIGNIQMGIRSSGILFIFSLLSVICGIPNVSTAVSKWRADGGFLNIDAEQLSYILYFVSTVIILTLNCFADGNPRRILCLKSNYKYPCDKVSFLPRVFVLWLDPLVWKNYRVPVKNYFWNLHPDDCATDILSRKSPVPPRNRGSTRISILKELSREFAAKFWYCALLKTVYETAPILLFVIFDQLLRTLDENREIWKAYVYCGLFSINIIVQIIANTKYAENCSRLSIKVKGDLLSTLYNKALRISNGARRDYTTSEIINLLSADVNKIQGIIQELHTLVSLLAQIILSYVFLWYILGCSVIINVFVLIAILLMSYYASANMKQLHLQEVKNKDIRGKFMQEIFTGIKVLKMYAWERSFQKVATRLRIEENKVIKKIIHFNTMFQVIFVCSPNLLSLFAFVAFLILEPNSALDIRKTFVTTALINSFRIAFQNIPNILLSLQQLRISENRVNKFLNSEEFDKFAVTHESRAETLLMEKATFSWTSKDGPTVLHNLTLKINDGSLVAVVGSVGAGKTSLVSAFLGEMYKVSGQVNTKGTIAYVPQQAWILNTTVKQNITLNENVNQDLYEKAIYACALEPDLEVLPAGDFTEIGEKGVNLSGGQKQRVSLARAVCRDCDIYFFDDPFSAVDFDVANHIFDKVVGPNGLLNNKTRLLVTHSTHFFPSVDQIVMMKDGRITDVGTYRELLSRNDEFCELLKNHSKNEKAKDDNDVCNEQEGVLVDENGINARDLNQKNSFSLKSSGSMRNHRKRIQPKEELASNKLIKEEHINKEQLDKRIYWKYISAAGIPLAIVVILLYASFQSTLIFSQVWLANWVSEDESENDTLNFLIVYSTFTISQILLLASASIILFRGTLKASTKLYNKLLENVLRWSMSSFDSTPIGRIINRFSDDVYVLDNVIGYKIALCCVVFARYISIMALEIYIIPASLIIIIPSLGFFYLVKILYTTLSHQLKRIELTLRSPLYSHAVESIAGIQSIRAYGLQEKFSTKFKERSDHCGAASYSSAMCARWLSCRFEIVGSLHLCFISVLCVMQRDSLSLELMALVITFTIQVARGLNFTVLNIGIVEESILSVERIDEYINYPQEASWEKSLLDVPKDWPTTGDIIFHRYQMRYRDGLDLVLKGLSFRIQNGEKIGIIGRTGAGKTSIILGLFRMIEPADGTILVDNIDITTIGLHKLRSKLTVIPQDPVLFSGTIRFNLDPFDDHSDGQLWEAIEKSHLKNFVRSLPAGLHYTIEEGGRNLSFGQRQLICLARALLRKSKILVLDEATASVDVKTDELIQKTIRDEFPDSTVITIAHRLNTLNDYDKILVLDDGRLVNFDTSENILTVENSQLQKMKSETYME